MRRRLLALPTAAGLIAAALAATGPARADDGDGMPTGDLPGWHQVLADDFSGQNVPVGGFSDCDHNADTPDAYCAGLPEPYRSRYWAYPDGWPDTAKQRGYPLGGTYDPANTISISRRPAATGRCT